MENLLIRIAKVLIVAALPVVEVRGAIPLGIIVYNINPILVFFISFLGNIIPAPFILIFLNKLEHFLMRISVTKEFYIKYINYIRRKSRKYIEKYGFWGLALFVAIPLPSTGVWTGSLAAYVFGVDISRALKAIILGSLMASTIVMILTLIFNITLT